MYDNDDVVGTQEKQEVPPHLPDGIGMSYKEISELLTKKHKSATSEDDPIMMLVTLMNVQLSELEKLHGRHNEALTKVLTTRTAEYVEQVGKTCKSLSEILKESSVEAIREIFSSQVKAIHTLQNNIRWGAAIVSLSALGNLVILFLR